MIRTRAYRRKQRNRHINHKAYILKTVWLEKNDFRLHEKGRLDKGKIHCSCRMCRRKSYDEAKISDMRKQLRAQYECEF